MTTMTVTKTTAATANVPPENTMYHDMHASNRTAYAPTGRGAVLK
jgi:hypothetical protein